jgi:hypothetical protein
VSAGLNEIAWSTDPTGGTSAWSTASLGNGDGFDGIACPSTSLCVAVANTGRVAVSRNPAGGSSAWTSALVDGPPCAQSTPCIVEQLDAYDDDGTSAVDTAGPGAGTSIANVALSGDALTWTHDGAPREATLN